MSDNSTIDEYGQCGACLRWAFAQEQRDHHECPPAYDVADEDGELLGTAYEDSAYEAAEWWQKRSLLNTGEPGEEEEHVAVRLKGTSKWEHFTVTLEYDPTYSASDAEAPDGWEGPADEGARD